jgi:hypothetical protein
MPPNVKRPTYVTYILHCWTEGVAWRYSLEELGSGKRHGFAGLDDFVSFLLARETLPDEGEIANGDAVAAGPDSS